MMRTRPFHTLMLITLTLMVMLTAPPVMAQSTQSIKDFLSQPRVKISTVAPANTVTTATATWTYSGQPAAGNILTISGAGAVPELYTFYANGGTYTGSNIGVELGATANASYVNLDAAIDEHSEFVTSALTTSTTTMVLTADTAENPRFRGHNGNYISLTDAVANATIPSALTGGASVAPGLAGSIWYQDGATTATRNIWIKSSDTIFTTGAWKRINPQ